MVVEEVIVDWNNNVAITLALPIDSEPTTEDSLSVQTLATVQTLEPSSDGHNGNGKLRYSWAVGLGPFKLGRIARQQPAVQGGAVEDKRGARPRGHPEAD